MITDAVKNLAKYSSVIPYLNHVAGYLAETDIALLEAGKYLVENENAYLLIQNYKTKPEAEKKWESHRKYIDIQIVLSGFEYMDYCPSGSLTPAEEYSESKDIIFYNEIKNGFSRLYIPEGDFAVFFPGEAHKPGCHISESSDVKKAVIKIICK